MSNTAAVLKEAKARITVEQRSIPTPKAHELVIKNRALATNPVDWKIQDYAFFVTTYPNILGSDIAGTVESVGEGVTKFKKGDRVAGYAGVIATQNPDEGAFQEYTILKDHVATKLPDQMSFEEGSLLPMAVATAGVSIWLNLEVPRPGAQKQSGGFLVWGASSSVGSVAVQIASLLGFSVYGVSSARHHDYVKSLGAKYMFDYNSKGVKEEILSAAKSNGDTIKYSLDAVSEGGTLQECASILDSFGGGKLVILLPWSGDTEPPSSVTVTTSGAFRILTDSRDFGKWLFNDWLESSLVDKSLVPSPGIRILEGGIPKMQEAFDIHKAGLSAQKLVLSLK
ncbi:hypothetical protein MMC20_007825 [Loxospora ochrophaea]|nr:hypothetical protein [Loxospora ochrophaea]